MDADLTDALVSVGLEVTGFLLGRGFLAAFGAALGAFFEDALATEVVAPFSRPFPSGCSGCVKRRTPVQTLENTLK